MALSISLQWISPTARVGGVHRAVRSLPPLEAKERILGRTRSRTEPAVVTEQALILGDRNGTWRRIGWTTVASAAWSGVERRLTLRLWPDSHDPDPQIRVAADERLAAIVRERVEYQRLLCVPVQLPGGTAGRVLALRDGDDVRWRVLTETSLDSPALEHACAVAIAEIRSLAGI